MGPDAVEQRRLQPCAHRRVQPHRPAQQEAGAPYPHNSAQGDLRRIWGYGAPACLRGPAWLDPAVSAGWSCAARRHQGPSRARAAEWWPEKAVMIARRPVMTGYSTAWLTSPAACGASGTDGIRLAQLLARAERNRLRIDDSRPRILAAEPQRDLSSAGRLPGPQPLLFGPGRRRSHGQRRVVDTGRLCGGRASGGHADHPPRRAATYEVGYASQRGRSLCASHLLLWHAMQALPRMQCGWLDMGGLATDGRRASPAQARRGWPDLHAPRHLPNPAALKQINSVCINY